MMPRTTKNPEFGGNPMFDLNIYTSSTPYLAAPTSYGRYEHNTPQGEAVRILREKRRATRANKRASAARKSSLIAMMVGSVKQL
jgi:hypothetical protein